MSDVPESGGSATALQHAAFVDIASQSELQKTVRCIKLHAEKSLFVLMTKPIFDDVNMTFVRGLPLDTTDHAMEQRVSSMVVTLPDIFVKWLRASRVLEAEEARTLKVLLGELDTDISPIQTRLSECDTKSPGTLFRHFVHSVYSHIITGQSMHAKRLEVTEAEVSRRITEVLKTISPMSYYFCREPEEAVEAVNEDIYKDSIHSDAEHGDSDSEPEHTGHEPDHKEHSGDSDPRRSDDSDSDRGSESSFDERDRDRGSGQRRGQRSDSYTSEDEEEERDEPLPDEMINTLTPGNLQTSEYVTDQPPSAFTSEHVEKLKGAWNNTTDYAVKGLKLAFGKKDGGEGAGGDAPGSDGNANDKD